MYVSVKRIADLLIEQRGNQAAVARALGLTRQAIWSRIQRSETLQQAEELGIREMEGDAHNVLVEGMAKRQRVLVYEDGKAVGWETVDEPDKVAVDTAKYVASRLNKSRWSERQEVTGADGGDLKVSIEYVNRPIEE